mgnify:CR=1 FL=1
MRTIRELLDADPAHAEGLSKTFSFIRDLHAYLDKTPSNPTEHSVETCRTCRGSGKVHLHPRSTGVLHPSSLGPDTCLQRLWYDVFEELKPLKVVDMKGQLIFGVGHQVHDLLQTYSEKMYGKEFKAEVPVIVDEIFLQGSADGVRDMKHARLMFEFKTINRKGFESLGSGPKTAHTWQATSYQAGLDLPFVVYVYFNKDTSDLLEFVRPFQADVWKRVQQQAAKVLDAPTKGPGAIKADGEAISSYTCRDCPYNYGCPFSSHKPRRT